MEIHDILKKPSARTASGLIHALSTIQIRFTITATLSFSLRVRDLCFCIHVGFDFAKEWHSKAWLVDSFPVKPICVLDIGS